MTTITNPLVTETWKWVHGWAADEQPANSTKTIHLAGCNHRGNGKSEKECLEREIDPSEIQYVQWRCAHCETRETAALHVDRPAPRTEPIVLSATMEVRLRLAREERLEAMRARRSARG
jgi:hypothetical protein